MEHNTGTNRQRVMLVLGAILLIIIVAFGVARFLGWKGGPGGSGVGDDVVRTELPGNEAPRRFPGDVPVPGNAFFTLNYEATAPDGREQSTRAYVDERSLADVSAAYQKYFADAGWKVLSTASLDKYVAFAAEREGVSFQVTLNEKPAGTNVTLVATDAAPKINN